MKNTSTTEIAGKKGLVSALHHPLLQKITRPVIWFLWLGLISAPLVFVRLSYERGADQWRAEFRADRWHGVWHDALLWVRQHGFELLLLALGIAAIVIVHRITLHPRWENAQTSAARKIRAIPIIRVGWLRRGVAAAMVFVLLILACRHLGNTQLEWAVMACTYAVLAMGLNLIVGMTGLLVLGYAGFVAVGAYTFAVMHEHWGVSLWSAFIPAAVIGAALGFVLGLPSIRLRGDYLAIVTLGFGETVRFLIKNFVGEQSIVIARPARVPALMAGNPLWDSMGNIPVVGPVTRFLFPDGLSRLKTELWLAAAMVFLSIWLIQNLMHSRIGRAWVAIREDETAAAAMGIPTVRMKLLAFTLSAVWAAVAGVFFVAHNTSANPEMFGFAESVLIVSMVVLGGMGGLWGPIVGALVLYLVPEILRERLPALVSYRPMLVGALMVAMMIFRPQGLLGGLRRQIELGMEK